MNNLFFTGKIQIGKSTLLKNILERIDASIGGFEVVHVSGDRKVKGDAIFKMFSLYKGNESFEIGNLFNMKENMKKTTKLFNELGRKFIEESIKNRDIIVMDELGVIESQALKFQESVKKALDSEKIVLGVLKEKDNEFLNYIKEREDVIVIEVTEKNRNQLLEYVLDMLKTFKFSFKKYGISRWDKQKIKWYNEALSHPENKYPEVFLTKIKEEVGELKNLNILDIGSGTGVFTFSVAKEGAKVTAIDSSFKACENIITNNCYKENIKCIIGDWRKVDLNGKYDIAICAFCQGAVNSTEKMKKLMQLVNKKIYVITYKDKYHKNFKVDQLYTRLGRNKRKFKSTGENVVNAIELCNLDYKVENIQFPFNQYFKNIEEAKKFCYSHFSIYKKQDMWEADKFLMENIKKYKSGYVFLNERNSLLYTINLLK